MLALRLIEAWDLRDRFQQTLDKMKAASPTAREQGRSECCRSGICCWRRPGQLALADIPKIAAFLGVSEQELFTKYLVVDQLEGRLMLLPARRHQHEAGLTGRMLDWRETYALDSPCQFLGEGNACTIHAVKPTACRTFQCWTKSSPVVAEPNLAERLRESGWNGVNPDEGAGG